MTTQTQVPDRMSEGDYKYFLHLINTRTRALVQAMASVDSDMLCSFLRANGATESALEEYETQTTGLSYVRAKYDLGLQDQVENGPDHKIIRPVTPEQQVANDVVEKLNGNAPTPILNREQRRAQVQEQLSQPKQSIEIIEDY